MFMILSSNPRIIYTLFIHVFFKSLRIALSFLQRGPACFLLLEL